MSSVSGEELEIYVGSHLSYLVTFQKKYACHASSSISDDTLDLHQLMLQKPARAPTLSIALLSLHR